MDPAKVSGIGLASPRIQEAAAAVSGLCQFLSALRKELQPCGTSPYCLNQHQQAILMVTRG